MNDSSKPQSTLPSEQQAIRDKCFHPSGTFVEFPLEDVESSIPARFEKIVRQYPNNLAIKRGDQAITYAELDAMTNRIANIVLHHNCNAGTPVAILFERGIEQIAAMIGILKAGHSFVLLDTSLPPARLAIMVQDFGPELTITNRRNASLASDLTGRGRYVIEIESIDPQTPADCPDVRILPDTLAFIVHTSGSSGRPKAVIYNHNTLLHHVMLRTNADGYCPMDRISHLSSGTANAITNTFFALLNGAALLPFEVNIVGIPQLCRWLSEERVTVYIVAAPLFRSLCEAFTDTDRFPDIRLLRLRSETVCKSDVELYKRYFANYSVLANGLSSSETHMLTQYYIDHETIIQGEDVPVGYPARDKEILLLDDQNEPVGYNKLGEIVIRSKYLSPSYWRNPELTAAKFRNDPEDPERRIYHTGDLGLMLPDGCLIHKGRKDFRVKIRGYGVEIGEVEKVIRDDSDIQDAVVVSKTLNSGESRLVAYITSTKRQSFKISQLRERLKTKLPDYMIPSFFVVLETLPLTSNGKLDRRALPDVGDSRPPLDVPYAPPMSSIETTLANIWSGVLKLERVGIHDNFFDLGGHSLAASRIITRVIRSFQLELPLKALFEAPTIAQMAAVIEASHDRQATDAELVRMLSEVEAMTDIEARQQLAPTEGE